MTEFWNKRTVLLTGASSGIGEGIALAIAAKGARIGLLARRSDLLDRLANRCVEAGGEAIALPADVRDAVALAEAAARMRDKFSRIDMLIANAGTGGNNAETRSLVPDAVRKVIDINLIGAVNSVHAVLPQMIEQGAGHLVAISSLAAYRGLRNSAAYSASKAGMTAFFESVRLDVQHRGIDVTIFHPGFIKTPLTSGRVNKMPFIMDLDDAIPKFLRAIERRKKFAAFPWQLALFAGAGRFMPAWLYDRIGGRANYRT